MYRRALLIFLSLFLLVLSSVIDHLGKTDSRSSPEKRCADKLHLISTGKTFSALFHETSNCKD